MKFRRVLVLGLLVVGFIGGASAATGGLAVGESTTFTYTGNSQSISLEGGYRYEFVLEGAGGGSGVEATHKDSPKDFSDGGHGGYLKAEYPLESDSTLDVYVGEKGGQGGKQSGDDRAPGGFGFNNGGRGGFQDVAGGGAGSTAIVKNNNVLASAGGGGGGGSAYFAFGNFVCDFGGGGGGGGNGGTQSCSINQKGEDAEGTGAGGDGNTANGVSDVKPGGDGGTTVDDSLSVINSIIGGGKAEDTNGEVTVTKIEPLNNPPNLSFTSISPDTPLIGETADFSYSASDPDGSIQSVDLTLKDDGSTVFTGSKTSSSGTFSPSVNLTQGDITAEFTATDDAGATTSTSLTRTLTDTKPVVNITQPSGTFFDYDQSIRVETKIDDSKPGEELSCTLELDGSQIDQRTVTEGDSYTVTTRADLGNHSASVTCTEQDDGKQDTGSTSFTVENFQFQTLTGVSTAEETTEQSFTAGFKAGDMVNNISFDLVYDGEIRNQATVNVSGVTDSSQGFSHVLNLAQTDGENRDYNVSAEVDYNNLNTGTSTDNVDSSTNTQTVNQAFSYDNSVFEDGLTQLEASTLDFEAQVNKQVTNNRASLSASSTLQQTGETRTLQKDGTNFTGLIDTDLINSTSTTTKFDTTVTVSFNGESRTFTNTDTLTLEKIKLGKSSSTGPKTLQFETRDEINNSLLDANVEAGITVNNPDQPEKTRFFGFDFSKDKTHELFLSPSDATITANVFEERSIAYENLDAGFPGRRHYLTDTTLDNETTNINLYLLEQTKGQTVRLELTNSDLQGLSNHLIRVERAFPDQNETRTVQLAKTGTEGFASSFLQLQERYIFTVFDENGDLVDQVGPETVTTSDKRIQVNDNIDPSLANVLNEVQFTDIQRGNQSLSVSYVSETQRLNNLFLKISSDGLFETQTLDVDSSEQPQGQLEVTDFNASEQKVFFELIGKFGETNLTLESGTFGQESNDFGNAGIFVSFLMFTALTLSGLFRPSAAIGLGVISIFVMSFTGFLAVGQQALISIAALAAVLIWRMSSQ